ncbi:hypothetical protein KC669_01690 [Candidatus Dojkabacteria bacterium]|uniref:Uncharacterized protein n=1 Tax=Candidatus Dojkabacteria bacterium TaxID=2099670 RepID=A0A955RL61_9BACT|nr:hypothetical protein [Candidatus Dojkabacteria bacterium]
MNDKKLTPLMYIIVTFIAILGFLILLVIDANPTSNNSDVSVTGFGEEATRELFPAIAQAFLNTDCDALFHNGYLQDSRFINLSTSGFNLSSEKISPIDNRPLQCFYDLGNGKAFTVKVNTYSSNSIIDATRSDLFTRVNAEYIDTLIDQDRIGILDYSFGTDLADNTECVSTIFHPLNDFESISIEYFGFDCEDSYNLNREVVTAIGNYIVFMVEDVYVANGTSTEALLDKWGYDEYITNLEFYR